MRTQARYPSLPLPSNPHANLRSLDQPEKTTVNPPAATCPATLAVNHVLMMHITVEAHSVTALRHLVMGNCGDVVSFMRIQSVAHGTKMKVWLCLTRSAASVIMDVVMRTLPSAEFGPVVRA